MKTNENFKMLKSIEENLIDEFEKYLNGESETFPLDDVLDINYILNSDFSYKGCRLLLTFGGPNIWLDTCKGQLELYWWTDHEVKLISGSLCNDIDCFMSELFDCR